jgi:transcriptional regulator with XRE-family HTH domain
MLGMRKRAGNPDSDRDSLARRLRETRLSQRLTQRRLSEISGIPHGAIGDIETGARWNLKLATIERLASALGVWARDLLPIGPSVTPGKHVSRKSPAA